MDIWRWRFIFLLGRDNWRQWLDWLNNKIATVIVKYTCWIKILYRQRVKVFNKKMKNKEIKVNRNGIVINKRASKQDHWTRKQRRWGKI